MSDFLDQALQSHVQWKLKLLAAVTEKGKIDKATTAVDYLCDLGKWIHGEGKRFESVEEFKALRTHHQKFHACVGVCADLLDRGEYEAAKKDITGGNYRRSSADTIDSILKLKSLAIVG